MQLTFHAFEGNIILEVADLLQNTYVGIVL